MGQSQRMSDIRILLLLKTEGKKDIVIFDILDYSFFLLFMAMNGFYDILKCIHCFLN